mmetsp:Transcript_59871/g.66984  ORF Transcript_59871/g.66984 Transcript_59871/m.66984 type:complete len:203 (-) Transcript_59871:129-737(-)
MNKIEVLFLIFSVIGYSRAATPTIQQYEKKTTTTTTKTAWSDIKNCKRSGFDPSQLSCSTRKLLPKRHTNKCEECCQEYITLEKQSKRYKTAILVNTGYPKAVLEFLNEDMDKIREEKIGLHIKNVDNSVSNELMMMMMMNQPEPSSILWFEKSLSDDELLSSDDTSYVNILTDQADEVMTLDGMGRDDFREMLLALLPDME